MLAILIAVSVSSPERVEMYPDGDVVLKRVDLL